jgi:heme/copper-type cytochrome/quinol oxidase subunit 3
MLTLIADEARSSLICCSAISIWRRMPWNLAAGRRSQPAHLVPGTLILIAGSVVMWWGERGIKRGNRRQLMIGLEPR